MSVYGTHFVAEALRDAGDHVLHKTSHCAELRDVFAASLPHSEGDLGLVALLELDVHVHVSDVLLELTAGALDSDLAGFDSNGDALRDFELLGLKNVLHLDGGIQGQHAILGFYKAQWKDHPVARDASIAPNHLLGSFIVSKTSQSTLERSCNGKWGSRWRIGRVRRMRRYGWVIRHSID
jgi:hypothetical protein